MLYLTIFFILSIFFSSTDNEDPIITGCNDVTVTAQPGNTTTRAYWTPPTATDNSGQVTVVGNANPGDEFAVGTTSIGYLATDGSNNQAMCAVNVIVRGKFDVCVFVCCVWDIMWVVDACMLGVFGWIMSHWCIIQKSNVQ